MNSFKNVEEPFKKDISSSDQSNKDSFDKDNKISETSKEVLQVESKKHDEQLKVIIS